MTKSPSYAVRFADVRFWEIRRSRITGLYRAVEVVAPGGEPRVTPGMYRHIDAVVFYLKLGQHYPESELS